MNLKSYRAPAIFLAAAAFPFCLSASSITNGLFFSGDVTITTNTSTGAGTLTFDDVAGQAYTFTVDSATGTLTGLTGGGNEINIGTTTAPVNTAVNIPDFLTFVNTPDLSFTLTYVYAGVDATAGCSANPANFTPGNTCSPAGTPYNLQDLVNTLGEKTSSASFVVSGDLIDNGVSDAASITFSSADTGESYEQILYDQEHGVPDTITYGAQLNVSPVTTSATPEPATSSLMMGAGLVLVGCMFRRNRRTR